MTEAQNSRIGWEKSVKTKTVARWKKKGNKWRREKYKGEHQQRDQSSKKFTYNIFQKDRDQEMQNLRSRKRKEKTD